jgi:hypothetical protein
MHSFSCSDDCVLSDHLTIWFRMLRPKVGEELVEARTDCPEAHTIFHCQPEIIWSCRVMKTCIADINTIAKSRFSDEYTATLSTIAE